MHRDPWVLPAACPTPRGHPAKSSGRVQDPCDHVKWDPQVLRQNIKFWALLAEECSWAVGQALPVTVRAAGVKAVSPAERGRSVATRLDADEHAVMLIGSTARVIDARVLAATGAPPPWPGGPRTLTPRASGREPNGQTLWYGAELSPDGRQVWFRITAEGPSVGCGRRRPSPAASASSTPSSPG